MMMMVPIMVMVYDGPNHDNDHDDDNGGDDASPTAAGPHNSNFGIVLLQR